MSTVFFKNTYELLILFLFSDGEIISQIKMTNLALAEIKELLKQQVKHIKSTLCNFLTLCQQL